MYWNFSREHWCLVAIVVAVTLAYSNSFAGALVFDDIPSIERNASIRRPWDLGGILVPPAHTTVEGRPLVNLSLALNYALGELDVAGYHIFNVAIHSLAALALFGLVRRTLLSPRLAGAWGEASWAVALSATLLWALHPLQTESVTYIVQRAESMVALAYLSMLYCVLRGATADQRPVAARWYAWAVAAAALGMATKEVMATAPVMALIYDRIYLAESWRAIWVARKWLYACLASTWLVLAAVVATATTRSGTAGFGLGVSPLAYLKTQFGVVAQYLALAAWPNRLAFDWGDRLATSPSEVAPFAAFILLLAGATLAALVWRPMVGYLGLWFFATIAPSSTIVPIVTQTAAEHRMYLPLASLAVLASSAVFAAWRRWNERPGAVRSHAPHAPFLAPLVLCLSAATALGVCTYRRNVVYGSEIALLEDSLAKRPDVARVWSNLAARRLASGDAPKAIELLDQALEIDPDFTEAYLNRSASRHALGEHAAALADAERALALAPDNATAYYQRANALVDLGRRDEALADYGRAIQLNLAYAKALYNRAHLRQDLGDVDRAIEDLDHAITIDPAYAHAYLLRGNLRERKGHLALAAADLTSAIQHAPRDAAAHNARGYVYQRMGRLDAAFADYTRALELQRNLVEAWINRGNVLGQRGDYAAAIRDHSRAIELDPNNAAAYRNRAIDYFNVGDYQAARTDVENCQRLRGDVPATLLDKLRQLPGASR